MMVAWMSKASLAKRKKSLQIRFRNVLSKGYKATELKKKKNSTVEFCHRKRFWQVQSPGQRMQANSMHWILVREPSGFPRSLLANS
jgi:murein L,D-transpeptidase YafK